MYFAWTCLSLHNWFNPYKLWLNFQKFKKWYRAKSHATSPLYSTLICSANEPDRCGPNSRSPVCLEKDRAKSPYAQVQHSQLQHLPPFFYSCLWRAAYRCLHSAESRQTGAALFFLFVCLQFTSLPVNREPPMYLYADLLTALTQQAIWVLKARHSSMITESLTSSVRYH